MIGEPDGSYASPIVEKGVSTGAEVVIIRPITIGKNAKIDAGEMVLCDVTVGCTTIGNPARIIDKQKKETRTYERSFYTCQRWQ